MHIVVVFLVACGVCFFMSQMLQEIQNSEAVGHSGGFGKSLDRLKGSGYETHYLIHGIHVEFRISTSAYRSYRGWSNTILGILYCFMLVVWACLSSKPHQRIRILQSSVLSAAYPAAESPRLLGLSGQRKPIALAHQNWLYNLIQPGWFIHPGDTSS